MFLRDTKMNHGWLCVLNNMEQVCTALILQEKIYEKWRKEKRLIIENYETPRTT